MVHTILGSGGGIGYPLALELPAYGKTVRLVSRNPKKVNETDELFPADLRNATDIDKAVSGSEVVYVTVGFEYNLKVWQQTWPPFMKAVIDACIRHNTKLVFFDNVLNSSRTTTYFWSTIPVPLFSEASWFS